jgi:transcriptional regulator with XRE-family HTH domain
MSKKDLTLLRVGLEVYMNENDYTLDDIAKRINRNRLTIHRFLRGKSIPRSQTIYQIKKLVMPGNLP